MAGGKHIFCSPQISKKSIASATDEEVATERERFLSMCLLLQADEGRYADLQEDLRKGVYRGRDEYPMTLAAMYDLLLKVSRSANQRQNRYRNGMNTRNRNILAQKEDTKASGNQSDLVPGKDIETHKGIKCFACNAYGHYTDKCPGIVGTSLLQTGIILTQQDTSIKSSWILLDTCSTHSIFNNTDLVHGI